MKCNLKSLKSISWDTSKQQDFYEIKIHSCNNQSIYINNNCNLVWKGWRLRISSILTHPLVLVIALTKTIRIMETIMWFCWFFVLFLWPFSIFTWLIIVIHTDRRQTTLVLSRKHWKTIILLSFGNFQLKAITDGVTKAYWNMLIGDSHSPLFYNFSCSNITRKK